MKNIFPMELVKNDWNVYSDNGSIVDSKQTEIWHGRNEFLFPNL